MVSFNWRKRAPSWYDPKICSPPVFQWLLKRIKCHPDVRETGMDQFGRLQTYHPTFHDVSYYPWPCGHWLERLHDQTYQTSQKTSSYFIYNVCKYKSSQLRMQTASSHGQSPFGTVYLMTSWTSPTTRPLRLLSRLTSAPSKFCSHPTKASKVTLMRCGYPFIGVINPDPDPDYSQSLFSFVNRTTFTDGGGEDVQKKTTSSQGGREGGGKKKRAQAQVPSCMPQELFRQVTLSVAIDRVGWLCNYTMCGVFCRWSLWDFVRLLAIRVS